MTFTLLCMWVSERCVTKWVFHFLSWKERVYRNIYVKRNKKLQVKESQRRLCSLWEQVSPIPAAPGSRVSWSRQSWGESPRGIHTTGREPGETWCSRNLKAQNSKSWRPAFYWKLVLWLCPQSKVSFLNRHPRNNGTSALVVLRLWKAVSCKWIGYFP